ncbi:hypothetical protein SDC9_159094 [bioreactor metagenome]|uniref:Uncharacterized protein n=1 Tax=bioreactor metagenome TaxID=1076179 RepID=A0A645FDW5_9ZZZZ
MRNKNNSINDNMKIGLKGVILCENGNKKEGIKLLKEYVKKEGNMEEIYSFLIENLDNQKEVEYYEQIRINKFSNKLTLIDNIKKYIEKNNIDDAKKELIKLEKNYKFQITSLEYSDLGILFGTAKEYEIAENCNNWALKYDSNNQVAINCQGVYGMLANSEEILDE